METPGRAAAPIFRRIGGALAGLALVAAAGVAATALAPHMDSAHVALLFVAPVILTALWFGAFASVSAALASVLAINFFFLTPRYTFGIARSQDVWALGVFVLVALITSFVAAQARAARLEATKRALQADIVRRYARDLAAAADAPEIKTATLTALTRLTGAESFCERPDSAAGATDAPSETARWAISTKRPYASAPDADGYRWRSWPIISPGRCDWALGVHTLDALDADLELLLEQIAAHAGIAFERARQAELAESARVEAESERLKGTLLAGVSHDLRTPLASMLLSLESVRKLGAALDAAAKDELLAVAESETRRLAAMVEDLLSAARIGQAGAPARREHFQLQDAIDALPADPRLAIAAVSLADLPAVIGDLTLAERALANVVENGLRYAAPSQVRVRGRMSGDQAQILVEDDGPGLGDAPEALLAAFVRGVQGDGRAPGLGLGLALARAYMRAQGGDLEAENRAEGGARLILSFQTASENS